MKIIFIICLYARCANCAKNTKYENFFQKTDIFFIKMLTFLKKYAKIVFVKVIFITNKDNFHLYPKIHRNNDCKMKIIFKIARKAERRQN